MAVNQNESEAREKRWFYLAVGMAGQVTFLLVAPVVLFLLLGLLSDNTFHTSPLFIILGVVLGFAGSVINVFKVMKIMDKM